MTVRETTEPELVKLRGDKQYSEVFAIPRVPNVIYTALLNGIPESNDMVAEITVDGGLAEDINIDIRADMKILVGSYAGGDDLGFCRVRAVPTLPGGAGTIKIGELSHIEWADNCHITIVDDYDIAPRHLKILNGINYIDYEDGYSDQHTDFDPIVNMGGHKIIRLSSGVASHSRSSGTSEVFDGTVSSYLWEAPNADSIADDTTSVATFEYSSEGHFCEYLTITSDDGKTWTGVRYVFVLPETQEDSNIISLNIEDNPVDGVSFDFEMPLNSTLTDFKHRAFVIIWAKTYYNGEEDYISYADEYNVLACGRISDERIVYNEEIGNVQFTAKNWKYWLSKISSFPFGLERAMTAADAWTTMTGLNTDRAVWEILHRYSTVTRICDFHPSGDSRYAAELSSTSNNLASQIEEIALSSIYAELSFDRFGSGWLRIEPQLIPESDRSSWVVIQEITPADYMDGLSLQINTYEEISQVSLSGVSVPQYGSGVPHFSLSYGRIFSPFGSPGNESNTLLENQEQSNSLSGLLMGWRNRLFDAVVIKFVGQNFMFSCSEYCRAEIDIQSSDNPRGISYSGYLIPRAMSLKWDEDTGIISVTVEFQDESVEEISVTGDFPPDSGIDVDLSFEPPAMPAFPPFAAIPMPISIINMNLPKKVSIASNQGVFFTDDFRASDPVWKAMNSGLTAGQISGIEQFEVTPSGAMYLLTEWTTDRGFLSLMYASGIGASWGLSFHADAYPVDPEKSGIWGLTADKTKSNQAVFHCGRRWNWAVDGHIGESRLGFASGLSSNLAAKMVDYSHYRRSGLVRAGDEFFIYCSQGEGILGNLGEPQLLVATLDGTFSTYYTSLTNGTGAASKSICRIGVQKNAMFWDAGAVAGYYARTTGAPVYSAAISPSNPYEVAFAPDGLHGMASSGISHVPYKTTDGGASWQSVGGVIPNGFDCWESCGDNNRFLFAGGTEIRITLDQGASYLNKAGNLSLIAPLIDIRAVRFISD